MNNTDEIIATWEKSCNCDGLSRPPSLHFIGATRPMDECDLTGTTFSLKLSHVHAPICQKCSLPWHRTLTTGTPLP